MTLSSMTLQIGIKKRLDNREKAAVHSLSKQERQMMTRNQVEMEEIFAFPAEMGEAAVWEAFGRRIALRRSERGWTRVELAKELGISRERLAKWERGENGPSPVLLIRLRAALGMSIDELM